jgi:hypothetical protein
VIRLSAVQYPDVGEGAPVIDIDQFAHYNS